MNSAEATTATPTPQAASVQKPMKPMPEGLEDLLGLAGAFRRAVRSPRLLAQSKTGAPRAAPIRAPASYVVNRSKQKVPVRFDMITERNEDLRSNPIYGAELASIDSPSVTAEVVRRFRNGMTTRELDSETAAICIQRSTVHSDYEWLAARIYVSDFHKRTPRSLSLMVAGLLAAAPDRDSARITDEFIQIVIRAAARIDERLCAERDYRFRFFGWQTIARSYLLRPGSRCEESSLLDDQLMERPQHLYMRVALGIFVCQPAGQGDKAPQDVFDQRLEDAFTFYEALSTQVVSNATPTMLNAATGVPQLSSCFQIATGDDLPTLFDTLKSMALVSKWSGGVSLWLHSVRAEGARIRKTGGRSSGIKRYIKIVNEVQLYVDQGGNRPGAFAIYLAPDHADILTFLAMGRLKGEEAVKSLNAPDLKYALWVPDRFMRALQAQIDNTERVAAGGADDPTAGDWHLFSPDEAPGLHLVYGAAYDALYERYVAEGRFRRRLKAGDVIAEAHRTWAQVGGPYVLYKDHVNALSNMKNVAPICSSNLCVSGDTRLLTSEGHARIGDLADRVVDVWNGNRWSSVTVRCTSEAAALVRVELDNGSSVDCTPEHKFYVQNGYHSAVRETRAANLQVGDALEKCPSWPVIMTGNVLPHAYTSGFFAADGHHSKGSERCKNPVNGDTCRHHSHRSFNPDWPRDGTCRAWCGYNAVNLYGPKKLLLDALDLHPRSRGLIPNEEEDRLLVHLVDDLLPKTEVPHGYDLESRLQWFAGLCDGDGVAAKNGANFGLQVASIDKGFLSEVRLLLQTLGCDPKIKLMHEERTMNIKGTDYTCKPCYRLLVSSNDLSTLFSLGFHPLRLAFPGWKEPARDARQFVRVKSVTAIEGTHRTFCFTEPFRHRGVFNGIYCGQCTEILIPSWSDFDAPEFARFHPGNDPAAGEFGVCNLAAICVETFVVEPAAEGDPATLDFAALIEAAALETRALNNIIDLSFSPSRECQRSNSRHRPIGLGIMGLADVLARLRLVYGSKDAQAVARGIAAAVYYGALRESARLAAAVGPYSTFAGSPLSQGKLQPDLWTEAGFLGPAGGWEAEVEAATGGAIPAARWGELRAAIVKTGARNAYVTAYMPTATTSNIVGQNECFEPFTSNVYTRRTLAGEFFVVNRHLMGELTRLGLWDEQMRRAIVEAGGSVQAIERVPAEVRRRYRTAREISPSATILMAKAMAPFICQSMSMNLFLDAPSLPKILRFLFEGWRAGLKTGMYYCHTRPKTGTQKTSVRDLAAAARDPVPAAEPDVCRRDDPDCAACKL